MAPSSVDDDDGDFDEPETHLDDDAYEEFVAREFRGDGAVRGDPPIGAIVLLIVLSLLVLAVVLLT